MFETETDFKNSEGSGLQPRLRGLMVAAQVPRSVGHWRLYEHSQPIPAMFTPPPLLPWLLKDRFLGEIKAELS
jgi:hypothetical protein